MFDVQLARILDDEMLLWVALQHSMFDDPLSCPGIQNKRPLLAMQ